MLQSLISGAAKARFALWAVEMALPQSSDLKQRFRSALWGVMAAVAGGVIASLAVAAVIAGCGYGLYINGLISPVESLCVSALLTLLVLVLLASCARKKLNEAFSALEKRAPRTQVASDDVFHDLINGFVEGLLVGNPAKAKKAEEDVSQPKPHFSLKEVA